MTIDTTWRGRLDGMQNGSLTVSCIGGVMVWLTTLSVTDTFLPHGSWRLARSGVSPTKRRVSLAALEVGRDTNAVDFLVLSAGAHLLGAALLPYSCV